MLDVMHFICCSVHETSTRAPKKDYSRWFKINVYFASYSILKIEEELLHNVFSRFGDVQDVVIRDHTIHPYYNGYVAMESFSFQVKTTLFKR